MKKKISIAILVIVVMIVAICVVGKRVGAPKKEAKEQFARFERCRIKK